MDSGSTETDFVITGVGTGCEIDSEAETDFPLEIKNQALEGLPPQQAGEGRDPQQSKNPRLSVVDPLSEVWRRGPAGPASEKASRTIHLPC